MDHTLKMLLQDYEDKAKSMQIINELISKFQEIAKIAHNCPELNMGNYTDDQVYELNNAMIEIYNILRK